MIYILKYHVGPSSVLAAHRTRYFNNSLQQMSLKKTQQKPERLLPRSKFHSWFSQTLFLPVGCFASAFCFFLHSSVTIPVPTEKHFSQKRTVSYRGSSRRDIFFFLTHPVTVTAPMHKWRKKHLAAQIWNIWKPWLRQDQGCHETTWLWAPQTRNVRH